MLGKVEICGVNTAKLPTLTTAQTDALLRRAKDGDAAAREKLVEGNLRLVLSVIQRFSGRGENADDLFQVGCVGLLKAIDNFDTSQNVRFSTYGVAAVGVDGLKERHGVAYGVHGEDDLLASDAELARDLLDRGLALLLALELFTRL